MKAKGKEEVVQETDLTPLEQDLRDVINKHSRDNASDTPDFALAMYLAGCLSAYEEAIQQRNKWHTGMMKTVVKKGESK
jgi:hypothetical protein